MINLSSEKLWKRSCFIHFTKTAYIVILISFSCENGFLEVLRFASCSEKNLLQFVFDGFQMPQFYHVHSFFLRVLIAHVSVFQLLCDFHNVQLHGGKNSVAKKNCCGIGAVDKM